MVLRRLFTGCFSCLLMLIATYSAASNLTGAHYDVYYGDVDSNGKQDIFFHGKDLFILLHGDIVTPIKVVEPSFVVYQTTAGYSAPQALTLDQTQIAALTPAVNEDEYFFEYFDDDGHRDALVRGATAADPALILAGTAGSDLPIILVEYSGENALEYHDLSDRSLTLSVSDSNGDGRMDILLLGAGSGGSDLAYLGDGSGVPRDFTGSLPSTIETAPAPATAPTIGQTVVDDSDRVGFTAGQFRVDESGNATYAIPFITAPASGGVAPQVGLSYSSQAGNGAVGVGWSISGLSSISRCRQTKEQDGEDIAVSLGTDDRFCLDGQRLIAYQGLDGVDGTLYRTEIDSFMRVKSVGTSGNGPDYFIVERKDGSVSRYGDDPNSYLESTIGTNTGKTLWVQTEFADSVGNTITYTYGGDPTVGEVLIDRIDYASNGATVATNYLKFLYNKARTDKSTGYSMGAETKLQDRLYQVDSYGSNTLLRSYILNYATSTTGGSLLESVKECVGDVCTPATEFDWHQPTVGLSTTGPQVSDNLASQYRGAKIGDVNGDGKADLVWLHYHEDQTKFRLSLSNGTSLVANTTWRPRAYSEKRNSYQLIDYNGDGKQDLLYAGNGFWRVALSTGNGFDSEINTNVPAVDADKAKVQDINGDGLPDIIYDQPTTSFPIRSVLKVHYMEKDGAGGYRFVTTAADRNFVFTDSVPQPAHHYVPLMDDLDYARIADFNGDGAADIVAWFSWQCIEPELCGTSTVERMLVMTAQSNGDFKEFTSLGTADRDIIPVDINGDGNTDLLSKVLTNPWSYSISTGDGFTAGGSLTDIDVPAGDLRVIDYNHDGFMDLIYPQGGQLKVRQWNGAGFDAAFNTGINASSDDHAHLYLDLDGDGYSDHIDIRYNFANDYVQYHFSNGNGTARNTLSKITNGLGMETHITYKPLTDTAVYTRGTGAPALDYGSGSPVFDFLGPTYVVSGVESSAPTHADANARVSVSYTYEAARLQAGGRGFLGFEKLTTLDNQTGVETATTYRQDFPYTGMPIRTEKKDGLTLIGLSENTPDEVVTSFGTVYPYVRVAKESAYDLSGTLTHIIETTTTYDPGADTDYGNVSLLVIDTQNAAGVSQGTKTTDNTYTNTVNTTTWHLGRLTHSTVTATRVGEGPETRRSEFDYDSVTGLLTDEWIERNTAFELRTRYVHDRFGNRKEVHVSAPGETTRVSKTFYDTNGRYVIRTEDAEGNVVGRFENHNGFGQPETTYDISGVSTIIRYSAFGKPYQQASETGAYSSTLGEWCSGGGCPVDLPLALYKVTSTGVDQAESVEYFDKLGRSLRQESISFDENGSYRVYTDTRYDSLSRVERQSAPYRAGGTPVWTVYTYDILGRTEFVDSPVGVCDIDPAYNGLTETTTACGQVKTTEKNVFGETWKVTDAIGGSLKYDYYALGQLKSVAAKNSSGVTVSTTSMTYDVRGRKLTLNDPDKGAWSYTYTGFGELKTQTDAKGQMTTMGYDLNGRVITREDYDSLTALVQHTRWYYDTGIDCVVSEPGQLLAVAQRNGALIPAGCGQATNSDYLRQIAYDAYGRPSETTTSYDPAGGSETYSERVTYDQYGRTFQTFDASNITGGPVQAYKNEYNAYGHLTAVVDAHLYNGASVERYYTIKRLTERGQAAEILYGNGLTTTRTYEANTGRLTDIDTVLVPGVSNQMQDIHYDWLDTGNMESRTDKGAGKDLEERFSYDNLNRLRYADLYQGGVMQSSRETDYDDTGNIDLKAGVGDYEYGGDCTESNAGPHAVCRTTGTHGATYFYDDNGNLTSDTTGRVLQYTTFDKPSYIKKGDHTTTFEYGPDRGRISRVDSNTEGVVTTRYLGAVEKVTHATGGGSFTKAYFRRSINGVTIIRLDLDAAGSITQERSPEYVHKDVLGSTDVISDDNGAIATGEGGAQLIFSFDVWGGRRNGLTWEALVGQLRGHGYSVYAELTTNRGYTGHEMLDGVGLIHMNGRVYDPLLARFVSADPMIDGVTSTQGYNRYAYVHNNPMAYTDPSGYLSLKSLYKDHIKTNGVWHTHQFINRHTPWAAPYISTGLNFIPVIGPVLSAAFSANHAYISTGSFTAGGKAFATSYASGLIYDGIGTKFQADGGFWVKDGWGHIGAHALTGGVMAELQGGKFGHGFFSAGFSKATTPYFTGVGNGSYDLGKINVMEVVIAATVGGTISVATGGKFANGAVTAAYGNLFNQQRVQKHNKENKEPSTYLVGAGVSFVVIYGVEASAGFLVTPGDFNRFDIGVFWSYGDGFGLNVSGDVIGGGNSGDVFNLMGETLNMNIVAGPVSITTVLPEANSDPLPGPSGVTVGVGPSLTPVAVSVTSSTTDAFSRQTLIRNIADGLCSMTGNC